MLCFAKPIFPCTSAEKRYITALYNPRFSFSSCYWYWKSDVKNLAFLTKKILYHSGDVKNFLSHLILDTDHNTRIRKNIYIYISFGGYCANHYGLYIIFLTVWNRCHSWNRLQLHARVATNTVADVYPYVLSCVIPSFPFFISFSVYPSTATISWLVQG